MSIETQMTEWRRHIHQHPETGLKEYQTAEFVASKLKQFGLDEVHCHVGKTGVVGVLKAGVSDRSIGLRADMDALFIHEQNDVEYASSHEGVMHACGHDGHTAMLLGAASELAQQRNFDGTIYFIFQPDEERGSGAKAMIEDGLFSRWKMDEIYAIHNMPSLPAGNVITRPGPIMASESSFEIKVMASGGHAAMPHMGTDPIVVGAQIVCALQTIVSRNLNAIKETAVLSVTEFITNGNVNVIPSEVTIKGDTRSFTDDTLHKVKAAIERIVAGQCQSAGVEYEYHFNNSFLSTINTPSITAHAVSAAKKVMGEDRVDGECQPLTISEDFSFMQRQVPSCYILMGNGEIGDKGGNALHRANYDFNDDILLAGLRFWTTLAEERLAAV